MAKASSGIAKKPPSYVEGRGRGRWLIAEFLPVSLFSLRMTHATSKGGKTLLTPTPYGVKMALLDACFRRYSATEADRRAREWFDWLKWREIRMGIPADCIVQNTFIKILDNDRDGDSQFKNTIAYREFAFFRGSMRIALATNGTSPEEEQELEQLLGHVNYFGKKGGFWQFTGTEILEGELPGGYTVPLDRETQWEPAHYGVIQSLDDFGEALCTAKDGFDRVSTYGPGVLKLGEHRVLQDTAIPYRRRAASRHSTWYRRIEG